jgi:tetratricopeptide (TPR) repeat protein
VESILKALEPYLSLLAAAGSLAALGLLLNLVRVVRETYADRVSALREQQESGRAEREALEKRRQITEERLKLAEEHLVRTKEWHVAEATGLRVRIEELLAGQSSKVSQIVASGGEIDIPDELRRTLNDILGTVREVREAAGPEPSRDPSYFLEIGKAFAATDQWLDAAEYYGEYLRLSPNDWEVHFLRAVALANSRRSHQTNLDALRSLNEAIALVPWDVDRNLYARLFAYRGADLKRLGRLEEAESDLQLARRWASGEYEIRDITYNMACVHALAGRREEMLSELRRLVGHPSWKLVVQDKSAYFKNFWNDPEFRQLVGLPPL